MAAAGAAVLTASLLITPCMGIHADVPSDNVEHQYDLVELDRSSNLVKNGDFEQGITGEYNLANADIAEKSEDEEVQGTYSGRITATDHAKANGHIWQQVTVEPDTDYVLKAKVKIVSSSEDTQASLVIKTGTMSAPVGFKGKVVKASEADDWTDVSIEFNSGSNTSFIIGLDRWMENATDADRASTVYLDDISLEEPGSSEPSDEEYEFVWADDFNEPELDLASWEYELGHIRGSEQQHYVDDEENVFIRDHETETGGELVLKATERPEDQQYVTNTGGRRVIYNSGSVRTHGKQEFLYGRIEMRAKLPKGQGVFPAFWTLGSEFIINGDIASEQGYPWARCGEIDIMELIGGADGNVRNKQIYSTLHHSNVANSSVDDTINVVNPYTIADDFNDEYHIFGMNWSKGKIEFYVDGQITGTVTYNDEKASNAFNHPMFIQMNLAMGGSWPGTVGEDLAGTEYAIDYIYYAQNEQQKKDAEEYYASSPKISGYQDLTLKRGDTDVLSHISVTDGAEVDFSITDQPMFKEKENAEEAANTSVDLLCKGKDDIEALAKLPAGTYTLYYTAYPEDMQTVLMANGSGYVPDPAKLYKFDRKAVLLTITERSLTEDMEDAGITGLSGYTGDLLSEIRLPDGWSWDEPDTVLEMPEEGNAVYCQATHAASGVTEAAEVNVIKSASDEEISDAIAEAEEILENEELYTVESITKLKEALEAMKNAGEGITNKERTQRYEALKSAISNIEKQEESGGEDPDGKPQEPQTPQTPPAVQEPPVSHNPQTGDGSSAGAIAAAAMTVMAGVICAGAAALRRHRK